MKKISPKIIAFVVLLIVGVVLVTALWPEKTQQRVEKQPPPAAKPKHSSHAFIPAKKAKEILSAGVVKAEKKAGPVVTARATSQEQRCYFAKSAASQSSGQPSLLHCSRRIAKSAAPPWLPS